MSEVGKSRAVFTLFAATFVSFLRFIYAGDGSSVMTFNYQFLNINLFILIES